MADEPESTEDSGILPRIEKDDQITTNSGKTTLQFQARWQLFAEKIEQALNLLNDQVAALQQVNATQDEQLAMIEEVQAIQGDQQVQLADALGDLASQQAQIIDFGNDLADVVDELGFAVIDIEDAQEDLADIQTVQGLILLDLADAQDDIADAISDIAAQTILIAQAQDEASEALNTTLFVSSFTGPSDVLSASDVGSSATITIESHIRVYPDGLNFSVSGGTITGRSFGTTYAVYYDDPSRADTTPSYQSTTNLRGAASSGNGRHFVGLITTPADGGSTTYGGNAPPTMIIDPTDPASPNLS